MKTITALWIATILNSLAIIVLAMALLAYTISG